jgi:hypothetical protein
MGGYLIRLQRMEMMTSPRIDGVGAVGREGRQGTGCSDQKKRKVFGAKAQRAQRILVSTNPNEGCNALLLEGVELVMVTRHDRRSECLCKGESKSIGKGNTMSGL